MTIPSRSSPDSETIQWGISIVSLMLMVLCTGYLFSGQWRHQTTDRTIICGTQVVTPDQDFYVP